MKTLHITVADKIAVFTKRDGAIVCGNNDYKIIFNFDEEWTGVNDKTARFIWNGEYYDVEFTGTEVNVPIITDADTVEVGVYAGELRTTTGADIPCKKSILCGTDAPNPGYGEGYTTEAKAAAEAAKEYAEEAAKSAEMVESIKNTIDSMEFNYASLEQVDEVRINARQYTDKAFETLAAGVTNLFAETDQRIEQLESATLKYTEDSTVAYRKVVPTEAAKYALVNKVGGMSYKTENLIPPPTRDWTSNGITFSVQKDGSIVANGTATGDATYELIKNGLADNIKLVKGKTYTFSGCPANGSNTTYRMVMQHTGYSQNFDDFGSGVTKVTSYEDYYAFILIYAGYTANNLVFRPMLNEGSTALPYSQYFEGLRDTKVTVLVSEGANLIPYPYNTYVIENGITFTDNRDGSIIINGKNNGTANSVFYMHKTQTPITLKAGTYSNGGDVHITLFDYVNNKYYSLSMGTPLTLDKDVTGGLYIQIPKGDTKEYKNFVVHPMMNYGTTAAPYKPYRHEAVDSFPISVKLLTFLSDKGYGRGVEGYYGYIDLENKLFYPPQTYRKVFDGTENWIAASCTLSSGAYRNAVYVDTPLNLGNTAISPMICNLYDAGSPTDTYYAKNKTCSCNSQVLHFYDEAYNTDDISLWKAHLAELKRIDNPLIVEYATEAVPEPIDISAYLTDDEIVVEGGGTITAVNEFENAAPSTISYVTRKGD